MTNRPRGSRRKDLYPHSLFGAAVVVIVELRGSPSHRASHDVCLARQTLPIHLEQLLIPLLDPAVCLLLVTYELSSGHTCPVNEGAQWWREAQVRGQVQRQEVGGCTRLLSMQDLGASATEGSSTAG